MDTKREKQLLDQIAKLEEENKKLKAAFKKHATIINKLEQVKRTLTREKLQLTNQVAAMKRNLKNV